ncbi:MAG: protein kinase [Gemmatimonadetes bacterium]|nr:protein kinase [Gemmatimonadota bacterium]
MTALRVPAPPLESLAPLRCGDMLFGSYLVDAVLGRGGMGTVYRVRHLATGEVRAAKVMHGPGGYTASSESLFMREAKVLSQLRHPGVVRYLDHLRDGDRWVLLMEYLQGESLAERVSRAAIPARELEGLLHALSDALASVHACGMVHRDLSLDNVILRDGDIGHPVLIDFGIAADVSGTSTLVDGFKGKTACASPEQLGLGGGVVGPASDVYSLGLLVAGASQGAPLPMGRSLAEAVESRRTVPAVPATLPPAIAGLVRSMLAPDPADRPHAATIRDATASAQPRACLAAPDAGCASAPAPPDGALDRSLGEGGSPVLRGIGAAAIVAALGIATGVATWGLVSRARATVPQGAAVSVAPVSPSYTVGAPGLSAARMRVLAEAERYTRSAWLMLPANVSGRCGAGRGYRSDFVPGQSVQGLAYDWGGNDQPEVFRRKLQASFAAGSHSWHGVNACTAGIDCSGFVGRVWEVKSVGKLSTTTLPFVAQHLGTGWSDRLLPGDALNRPGRHVVLYAGRSADGRPIIYEALAAASRVIRNEDITWARLRRYAPMRNRSLGHA